MILDHLVKDHDLATSLVQVGVVHGGVGECGSPTFPGIYARLDDADNLNFVRQAIGLGECTARVLHYN